MGCEALATRAELAATQAELSRVRGLAARALSTADEARAKTVALEVSKLDKSEKQSIIQSAVDLANQIFSPQIAAVGITATSALGLARIVQTALAGLGAVVALLEPLIPFVIILIGMASLVSDLYNRIFAVDNRVSGLERHYDTVIEVLETDVKQTRAEANAATIKANAAIEESKKATVNAHAARKKADQAIAESNEATQKANVALLSAQKAISQSNTATAKADEAIVRSNNAITNSNLALREADLASNDAEIAQQQANKAISEVNRFRAYLDKLLSQINRTIADIQRQTAPFLPFTRKVEQNTQDIRNLDNNIRSGVITTQWSPTVWQSGILQPTVIEPILGETTAITTRIYGDTRQIINVNAGASARDITRLSGETTRLSEKITALQRTTTNANQKVNEQEQVNSQAIPLLRDLQNRVAQIPVAVPVAVGAIIPGILSNSQPFTQRIGDIAREANCDTAKPNGCVGRQFGGLNNKLDDIGRAADAGAQALQLRLLQGIDQTTRIMNTKIGDVSRVGSLGTAFSRAYDFLGIDRMLTMFTAMGVLHNALMLSNNLDDTLFSIIDNLINAGVLIVNPGGQLVSSQDVFGKAIDKFMLQMLGAENWAAAKAAWKSAGTIISTSANAYNNVRSIMNDSQEIMNTTNNWVAQLGNGLQDEGLIGEDNWKPKPDNLKLRSPMLGKLNDFANGVNVAVEALEAVESVTSQLLSIVQTANEIKENVTTISTAVSSGVTAATTLRDNAVEAIDLPDFAIEDIF